MKPSEKLFIACLAEHPDAGDVIPAKGGLRNVRWSRLGMGKRGDPRVICMLRTAQGELVLLIVYAKAEHDNLSSAFLRQQAQLLEE